MNKTLTTTLKQGYPQTTSPKNSSHNFNLHVQGPLNIYAPQISPINPYIAPT